MKATATQNLPLWKEGQPLQEVLTDPECLALPGPGQGARVPGPRVVRGGAGQHGQVLLQVGHVHAQHLVAYEQEAWNEEKSELGMVSRNRVKSMFRSDSVFQRSNLPSQSGTSSRPGYIVRGTSGPFLNAQGLTLGLTSVLCPFVFLTLFTSLAPI